MAFWAEAILRCDPLKALFWYLAIKERCGPFARLLSRDPKNQRSAI